MRPRFALAAAAILAAGCTEIIPATRENAYAFKLPTVTDSVSFLWPRDSMPLRIWVDPAGALYEPTKLAITRWQNALLYGEFRGVIVADSNTAHIIIHNAFPPPEGGPGDPDDPGEPQSFRRGAMANQCTGFTTSDLDLTARTLSLPILVYVYANGNQPAEALATCYRITTTHELGHALGIISHSASSADVMFNNPILDGLSVADRETMEIVFHTTPNLTFIPRASTLQVPPAFRRP